MGVGCRERLGPADQRLHYCPGVGAEWLQSGAEFPGTIGRSLLRMDRCGQSADRPPATRRVPGGTSSTTRFSTLYRRKRLSAESGFEDRGDAGFASPGATEHRGRQSLPQTQNARVPATMPTSNSARTSTCLVVRRHPSRPTSISGPPDTMRPGNSISGDDSVGPSSRPDAKLGASVEAYRDALVTLVADVATNYVQIRTFQRARQCSPQRRDSKGFRAPRGGAIAGRQGQFPGRGASERSSLAQTEATIPPLVSAAGKRMTGFASCWANRLSICCRASVRPPIPVAAGRSSGRHSRRIDSAASRRAAGVARGGCPGRANWYRRGRFLSRKSA